MNSVVDEIWVGQKGASHPNTLIRNAALQWEGSDSVATGDSTFKFYIWYTDTTM